jgi:hypothetical protein
MSSKAFAGQDMPSLRSGRGDQNKYCDEVKQNG